MENKSQTRGLKPFVKGDVRINRTGRPRGFDEMRRVALRIACETVTLRNGRRMSVIEALLRSWVCSKEPALQIKFMEIAFGKVPENVRGETFEPKTTLILHYAHERPDLLGERSSSGLS